MFILLAAPLGLSRARRPRLGRAGRLLHALGPVCLGDRTLRAGHPGALDLVRHILLASASIPAAFPPVMFDVEANGNHYQEMHVDGGAVSQAFLVPPTVNIHVAREKAGYRRNAVVAYVIRNSRLNTEWSDVERQTLSIAQKAVSTMINYNGVGDLYRKYLVAQRARASFDLAYISDNFRFPGRAQRGLRSNLHARSVLLCL